MPLSGPLLLVLALIFAAPAPAAAAGGRLELAAMALVQADLPNGYGQEIYDDEGYTPGGRIAAVQYGGTVTAAEVVATGISGL